jgi:hypothetical protein
MEINVRRKGELYDFMEQHGFEEVDRQYGMYEQKAVAAGVVPKLPKL